MAAGSNASAPTATRGAYQKARAGDPASYQASELLLERLEATARRLGAEVRERPLRREEGYFARGGSCRVGERTLVILDRDASISDRIEVLLEFLAETSLAAVYVEPEIRRLVEQGRPSKRVTRAHGHAA